MAAIGFIETKGLVGNIEATDAMLKACLLYTSDAADEL